MPSLGFWPRVCASLVIKSTQDCLMALPLTVAAASAANTAGDNDNVEKATMVMSKRLIFIGNPFKNNKYLN